MYWIPKHHTLKRSSAICGFTKGGNAANNLKPANGKVLPVPEKKGNGQDNINILQLVDIQLNTPPCINIGAPNLVVSRVIGKHNVKKLYTVLSDFANV